MDVQHPSGEAMSSPAAREDFLQGDTESITKLQDKAVVDENVGKEKPAPDTDLSAVSGVSSSGEYQTEEQPADRPASVKMLEPSTVISTPLPAEKWLVEISNQWSTGKKEEAIANLQRFLKSYPEYTEQELAKHLPNDFDLSNITQ